ncbi:MAG: rhodanese-related sulfurtransferase [Woeseia sp.]
MPLHVASFYRFIDIETPESVQAGLEDLCGAEGLLGTILVANEGFNGTLAGSKPAIESVFAWIDKALDLTSPVEARWTQAESPPFKRMKVRIKQEIVTLGRPDIRPQARTGRHVPPAEWNALIDDPDTLLIDTRNHYEIDVGTFPAALDPGTDSFRQFPAFAVGLADVARDRQIAMYCTGGIRCEKASALLQEMGFSNVNQLEGGILNYLEQVRGADNRWRGECFVFDNRVAMDRDLAEGGYEQCHACRRPLSSEDLASGDYREGVSCPHCINKPGVRRPGQE